MCLLWHRRLAVQVAAILGLATVAAAQGGTLQPMSAKLVRHWTGVAACETGSGGAPKWDWGSKHRPGEGSSFEGGVGFSASMWQNWAGRLGILVRFPHAYDAPPLVQMQVAQYGVTTDHAAWGCKG